jgi:AraC-like DNA-binding protein
MPQPTVHQVDPELPRPAETKLRIVNAAAHISVERLVLVMWGVFICKESWLRIRRSRHVETGRPIRPRKPLKPEQRQLAFRIVRTRSRALSARPAKFYTTKKRERFQPSDNLSKFFREDVSAKGDETTSSRASNYRSVLDECLFMKIGSLYKPYVPQERILGVWETREGLAFLDRERQDSDIWRRPEPRGLYHVYIQTKACKLWVKFNNVLRYSGRCPAGAVLVARPDEKVFASGCGPIRSLQASFTPAFLKEQLSELSINPSETELREIPFSTDAGLESLVTAHQEGLAEGLRGNELYFDTIRQAILNRIVVRHATRQISMKAFSETLSPAKTNQVLDYINANLSRELRLLELATVAGFSRAHFARAFRNMTGMSPHTYITERRLARALCLVRKGRMTIAEIALDCGFADQSHLSRSFKTYYGVSPSRV